MGQFLKYKYLFIVLVCASWATYPLLQLGFYPSHDGEYHLIRFYEFYRSLSVGQWYPRWAPDLAFGYGVPLFTYVYPLPNYIASFLHFFGISFGYIFQLELAMSVIIGAVFFYLWTKEFWGEWGGVVSSVFYTTAPYHYLDVYIRGSVGEAWALALFPAFLWAITEFVVRKSYKYFLISSISLSLIIFSHNILAVIFFPFALFYTLILLLQQKKIFLFKYIIFVFIIALLLSILFWFPALFEKQYVVGLEIFDVTKQFPDLFSLLIPTWGSGFAGGNLQNQMSFQVGVSNIIAILVVTGLLSRYLAQHVCKKEIHQENLLLITGIIFTFYIVFFMMLPISTVLWETIPFLTYFQFPWRLLSIEIVACAFLAGFIFKVFERKINNSVARYCLIIFFILVPVLVTISYARPAYYFNRDDNYYISRSNFIDGTNSVGNAFNTKWANNITEKNPKKLIPIEGTVQIVNLETNGLNYRFDTIVSTKFAKILVNRLFFPTWNATLDHKKIAIEKNNRGIMMLTIPNGRHSVTIFYQMTSIELIATFISISTLILLIGASFYARIRKI